MRLKELRKRKGLTQEEISKIFNILRTRYSTYELETAKPDYTLLIRFADFYNVSLDYLLERDFNNHIEINEFSDKKQELIKLVISLKEIQLDRIIGMIQGYLNEYNATQSVLNNPYWRN